MQCIDCDPYRVYIDGELHCSYWSIKVDPNYSCGVGDKYEEEQERKQRNEECYTCAFYNNGCCDDRGGVYVSSTDYCDEYHPKISGCFIVTACIKARNLPNDCDELMTLREYRDTYVLKLPNGEKEVKIYYKIAPYVVKAINNLPNSKDVYEKVYTSLVVPCTEMVHEEKYEEAYILYKETALGLGEKYLGKSKLENLINQV